MRTILANFKKIAAHRIYQLPSQVHCTHLHFYISLCVQTTHRTYAAQLCSLFVEVEAAHFQKAHLPQVLPIIIQQIDPEKFEKVNEESIHNP